MATRKGAAEKRGGKQTSDDDVLTTVRLERPLHQRLRKLAFDQEKDMRELIVEGIELVLKREKY